MAIEDTENLPPADNLPEGTKPTESNASAWIKSALTVVVLVLVVVASFWISFQLGKRILLPVKKVPEGRIEAVIPEPPPSIKALQKLRAAVSLEAGTKEVRAVAGKDKVKVKAKGETRKRYGKQYYKVQAGLYANKNSARKLSQKIEDSGFSTYIKKVRSGWRVQAGAFRSRGEAAGLQKSLRAKGFKSQIIHE